MPSSEARSEVRRRLELIASRSPSRRQVIHLLVQGKSRKAIAAEMRRSLHTIDWHVKEIYRELGIGDRAQLILVAQSLVESSTDLLMAPPPPPEMGAFRKAEE